MVFSSVSQTKTELLQVVRGQDASVCSSINLHWDGAGIIDLDCSDDPLRVYCKTTSTVFLRCNGIEYYRNWFRVLIIISTIIWALRDRIDLFLIVFFMHTRLKWPVFPQYWHLVRMAEQFSVVPCLFPYLKQPMNLIGTCACLQVELGRCTGAVWSVSSSMLSLSRLKLWIKIPDC